MARTKLFDQDETLKKAMELFWKKGYHATSMQDLVSGLGISRSSLYDTYGGKEELFNQAFALYRQQSGKAIQQVLEKPSTVKEKLLAFFEHNIDNTLQDEDVKGCFVVNSTTELIPGESPLKEVIRINRKESEQMLFNYLQKGVDAGEIAPEKDLKAIAAMLFTLSNGLQVIAKTKPEKEELMNVVRTALNVLG